MQHHLTLIVKQLFYFLKLLLLSSPFVALAVLLFISYVLYPELLLKNSFSFFLRYDHFVFPLTLSTFAFCGLTVRPWMVCALLLDLFFSLALFVFLRTEQEVFYLKIAFFLLFLFWLLPSNFIALALCFLVLLF